MLIIRPLNELISRDRFSSATNMYYHIYTRLHYYYFYVCVWVSLSLFHSRISLQCHTHTHTHTHEYIIMYQIDVSVVILSFFARFFFWILFFCIFINDFLFQNLVAWLLFTFGWPVQIFFILAIQISFDYFILLSDE